MSGNDKKEDIENSVKAFFQEIIGTEDIVYIGSANFSNESANNIETGVIIEDKVFIQKLYSEFFDAVKNESLSYYDESFSAFSLFVLSLYAKFEHHYNKIITNVYTDYERTKLVVAETIFISVDELDALYRDLEELEGLCNIAEETYDEENDGYNEELDDLKEELQEMLFVIGPEGGFSIQEENFLMNNNFKPISLGKRVLRVETAAIYVASIINYVYGG